MTIDRRSVLFGLGAVAACACGGTRRSRAPRVKPIEPREYLDHAAGAARYIRRHAVTKPDGLVWRKSPDEPESLGVDLYHGSAGVVVFLLELFRATNERAALDEAIAGMAHIVATWPETFGPGESGLYGGLAGHAFMLHELARTTGDARHRAWRRDAIARLEKTATPASSGGRELAGMTDILYGAAGVILALVAIGDGDDRARPLAIALGDGLLGQAQPTPKGKRWLMFPDDTRELPNFSHGTAGIAYALARLYEVTREQRFLEASIAGAEHILSLARTEGDVCLVPHVLPDGAERYYLAYCHGPAGTARLFHQLHHVTRDRGWAEWLRKSINGVLYSGLPLQRTPGFWDNVGQCCGTAAIAELALSLHRLRGEPAYRELAETCAADIVARATAHDRELEWIHAENRAEPYWKQSYTGYMQGAAGIGSMFIRLARPEAKVRLPDNPWPA